jgi:hypothetical protein
MSEALALALVTSIFPASVHFGALRGAPLRPALATQRSKGERLIFRYTWHFLVVNGVLAGLGVFLGKSGMALEASAVALFALPTVVAQLTCLIIAKTRDVASNKRDPSNVR